MIAKVHRSQGKIILAMCDNNILGRKFEEKGLQLDLTSDFYNGKEEPEERLNLLIKAASILNFVGKESVSYGIKQGVVDRGNVGKIKGIPHAQAVRL